MKIQSGALPKKIDRQTLYEFLMLSILLGGGKRLSLTGTPERNTALEAAEVGVLLTPAILTEAFLRSTRRMLGLCRIQTLGATFSTLVRRQ